MPDPVTPLLLGLAVLVVGLSPFWGPWLLALVADRWLWRDR